MFLAIELPDEVRAALKPVIDDLDELKDHLRVNSLDRVHLTLHFLGHLPKEQVDELRSALEPLVAKHARFDIEAAGVGAFPGFGRPQVLWAGIVGEALAQLTSLQSELGGQIARVGIPVEDRFHPHLTLARVRRPIVGAGRAPLRAWQARWKVTSFGAIPVHQVALMRSELGNGPPRYSRLASFYLE